jgi:ribosomal silencing factor RsfS
VVAVLGGIALMAVLAFAVFQFGLKNPSPPSLIDNPNSEIAGRIVYVNEDGCIIIAEASGESRREVTCVLEYAAVTWVDEGHVAYARFGQRTDWVLVDIETGEEEPFECSGCQPYVPPEPESITGERWVVVDGGDVWVEKDGERWEAFNFKGPEHEWPQVVTWSPDGEWLLVRYWGKEEVWIVKRDGSFAGTLVTNLGQRGDPTVSWWIEGYGYLPDLRVPPVEKQ